MSNEVVTTQENQLANPVNNQGWDDLSLDASDIIIPKILLMQSDSKLVEEEKAKNKDFVNSSTKEVMESITCTPFDIKKVFKISKKVGNATEFVREEPWTKENDGRDKEWDEADGSMIAQKIWRFYVLVEGEGIPFVLDLRGMSFNTGKRLANQMLVANRVKGMSPAGYKIVLGNEKQEYEGATKNVFTFKLGAVSNKEEVAEALMWKNTLAQKDMILDNSEDSVETAEYQSVDTVDEPVKEEPKKEAKKAPKETAGKDDLPW